MTPSERQPSLKAAKVYNTIDYTHSQLALCADALMRGMEDNDVDTASMPLDLKNTAANHLATYLLRHRSCDIIQKLSADPNEIKLSIDTTSEPPLIVARMVHKNTSE